MLVMLLDSPLLAATDISSLRTIVYGAAPITSSTLRRALSAFGPILIQSYGQTEVFAQISVLSKADHSAAAGNPTLLSSAGRAVAIADVRIGDDDCHEVPADELGEILIRGPHSFLGYLNRPAETEAAMTGGWLHTGDIGRRDHHGFLYITDRKKDMIISGGFNVYPREVEDVLDTHPLVKECCVVGLPDEKWGEQVTAVLVVSADTDRNALAQELIALVKQKKASVYAPKSVFFVDAIPLTSVGKYDKKALVHQFSRTSP
jgi:fatty-acyl-CoA synthase